MRNHQEKLAYSGKFVQVKESLIDGHIWEKAYFPDSLVVFPFDRENKIIMIKERRPHEKYPVRLKFVTGHLNGNEISTVTANREMMEEIGYKAETITEFMRHESTGTINSKFHYIAAKDLKPHKIPNPDGEESIEEILSFSLEELKEMYKEDKLPWSLSALGLFKILQRVEEGGIDSLFIN